MLKNLDFEVASNQLKIGQLVAYGDFVNVKTVVGLERFEVGKSRNNYDVPFRS